MIDFQPKQPTVNETDAQREARLEVEQAEGRPARFSHDKVAAHLARFLRERRGRVTWENIALGGSGDCRPDVFSIKPTLNVKRCQPATHEVKVSRADFMSDMRSEKWRRYLPCCSQIYFAAPRGIIRVLELPREVGLCELNVEKKTWSVTKAAPHLRGWALSERHLMKLILGRWGTSPIED